MAIVRPIHMVILCEQVYLCILSLNEKEKVKNPENQSERENGI